MKFQSQYNRDQFPDRGHEKGDLKSMTVPNQSLTVKELVYRFTHNMDLNGNDVRVYDSENSISLPSNWNKLDLSEKMAWLGDRQDEAKQSLDKVNAERNRIWKENQDKEVERRVQEKLKAHADAIKGGANIILKKPEGMEGGE